MRKLVPKIFKEKVLKYFNENEYAKYIKDYRAKFQKIIFYGMFIYILVFLIQLVDFKEVMFQGQSWISTKPGSV